MPAVHLPKKLKVDSVVEALVEIRFSTTDIPELTIGKLASIPKWASYEAAPLPVSNIPAQMRRMDQNLQFLPVLERRSDDGHIVRFGDQVFSYHRSKPYPDWPVFGKELHEAVDALFGAGLPSLNISRLAMKYINAFTDEQHGVGSINDLALKVTMGEEPLNVPFMVMYRRKIDKIGEAVMKVASKELVTNPSPANLVAVVDIDIYTTAEFECDEPSVAHDWIEAAHIALKSEYFGVYTPAMRDRLIES